MKQAGRRLVEWKPGIAFYGFDKEDHYLEDHGPSLIVDTHSSFRPYTDISTLSISGPALT